MGIKIISEEMEVESGYRKVFYQNKTYEIILSELSQYKVLPEHNHRQIQFGYCFKGRFVLNIEDTPNKIEQGESYVLNSDIRHSVIIEQDIYSLDFKLNSATGMREAFQKNVRNAFEYNDLDIWSCTLGHIMIYRIHGVGRITNKELSSKSEWIILSAGISSIINESSVHHLLPMKIYQADMQGLNISSNEEGLIIICL